MIAKSSIVRSLLATLVFFTLVGCATGPQFSGPEGPSAGNGVVYVYRPSKQFGSWGCQRFSIDVSDARPMTNGGFYRFELPKGFHLLKGQTSWCSVFPVNLPFTLGEGEILFVRYNVLSGEKPGFHRYDGPDDIWSGYEIVPAKIAFEEIKELKRID